MDGVGGMVYVTRNAFLLGKKCCNTAGRREKIGDEWPSMTGKKNGVSVAEGRGRELFWVCGAGQCLIAISAVTKEGGGGKSGLLQMVEKTMVGRFAGEREAM